jgi:hypothetical protein
LLEQAMSHNQLLSVFHTLSDIRSAVVIAAARRYVTGKDVETSCPGSVPDRQRHSLEMNLIALRSNAVHFEDAGRYRIIIGYLRRLLDAMISRMIEQNYLQELNPPQAHVLN